MDHLQTPHGRLAAEFANALVAGNFDQAHGMLSAAAKGEWDQARLQTTFRQMVEYLEPPLSFVGVMEVMTEWQYPAMQPNDIGWAYAAIAGGDGSEAVTVIVSSENGTHVIRNIEWGRP